MADVELGGCLSGSGGPEVSPVEIDELWRPIDTKALEQEAIAASYDALDGSDPSDPLPVAGEEVEAWQKRRFDRIREAGVRATWEGRRGLRERSFADRDAVGPDGERIFKGRHTKCKIPEGVIVREYGDISAEAEPVDEQG